MSVHAKLLEAQRSVDAVVKRGQNSEQNYQYAMAADVVGVCRKALHGAGLLGAVRRVRVNERHPFETKKGTKGLYVEMVATFRVTDPESGESLDFDGVGAGADYGGGDKASLKASTAARKYATTHALDLPFADHDPERDVPGEAGRLPEQKADPATALSEERVDEIGAAVKAAGIGFERLCVLFGAVGADAPRIRRKDSIRKAVASLSEDRAAELEGLLSVEAK